MIIIKGCANTDDGSVLSCHSFRSQSAGIVDHRPRRSLQNLGMTIQNIAGPMGEHSRGEIPLKNTTASREENFGSLYLFNSLPQPTPDYSYENNEHLVSTDEIGASGTHRKQGPNFAMCKSVSKSRAGRLEKVSVDSHCLQTLSSNELKIKLFLVSLTSADWPIFK